MFDLAAQVYDLVACKDLENKNKIRSALKKLNKPTDPLMVGAIMRIIKKETQSIKKSLTYGRK